MAEYHGDKSQEPTPHRRQKAREQGQVAKSQDLGSAVLLLVGLLALWGLGGALASFLKGFAEHQLGGLWLQPGWHFGLGQAIAEYQAALLELARLIVPILGLLFLAAIMVNVLQIGFLFLPQKLLPDVSRLDPIRGTQRLCSLSNVVRLAFGLFKIGVIGTVAFVSLYNHRNEILGMAAMEDTKQIAGFMIQIIFWTSFKIALALLVLALLDYAFQRWKHERDLKMTTQEVREEMKHLEGNPEIIARRKLVQRQLAMTRLSDAVPKADVVITNPTELAVAVQYEPESMAAPIVVAKGAGVIALRIRDLALKHGIAIVEKKPLARALYRDVAVGNPVPEQKYAAVAEVLAYVYQLKGKQIPNPPATAA